MNKQELKNYVEQNPKLVSKKDAGPGIFVLKYKKKVFYDDVWNRYTEECRGTIVTEDYEVVSRPFTKIYNYGIEKNAPKLDPKTLVTAYRKVNGFMVAMTWRNNDILVSTTGSTDSDYVNMAKEMMLKHMCWDDWQIEVCGARDSTLMFECVHPNDPHIVVEKPGMYFIGHRANSWDSKVNGYSAGDSWTSYGQDVLHCYTPEWYRMPLEDLLEKVKTVQHEGFVFYAKDGQAAKLKSPYYLTSKWVARNPRTDKLMRDDIKNQIDEEYYPLIDAIRENIEVYTAMDEQERLAWVRSYLEKQ